MYIPSLCPSCSHAHQFESGLAGTEVDCQSCGEDFVIEETFLLRRTRPRKPGSPRGAEQVPKWVKYVLGPIGAIMLCAGALSPLADMIMKGRKKPSDDQKQPGGQTPITVAWAVQPDPGP